MAQMAVRKQPPPVTINKFLGLNENKEGQFNLQLGEASHMLNFRITPQYQLKQREGYKEVFNLGSGNIQGMWYGKLNGQNFFLFCHGGHLYKGDFVTGVKTDLGTLTDAPTRFIPFGTKVYLNNGYEYKSFDGTTFATVTGYRPLIAIGTPPAGGGTLYEEINVLTGAKRQGFRSNGTVKIYQLAETSVTSVDYVMLNGITKTLTTDYTVNLVTGQVTFVVQPPNNATAYDDVEIGWTKGIGQRTLIEWCRFSMDYSGQSDSRVFLWGNTDYKNRRFWSGLADGVPSAEYFEADAWSDEGNGQYAITDIVKQYDRQKIFLENGARYSYYETQTIGDQVIATFPSYELNDEVGNVAFGQVQIVNNMPLSIYAGVRAWEASTVRDQTNERLISQRVQDSLDDVDLTVAITYNWKENKEYWLNIDSTVWIYNYGNDTWYKFDNIDATCFIVINGQMYFGGNGHIYKFDTEMRTDNGSTINAEWEMGFFDFGAEYLTKYLNNIWVSIKPESKSRLEIIPVTNTEGNGSGQTIYYNLATYKHVDYGHWSYNTSYNPQPFYVDISANGFAYFKLVLKNNNPANTVTILSINMPGRYGGRVR